MVLRFNPPKGTRMSVFTRIARGCHLGVRSLIVVLRDKTLLVFPLIPFTCVIAVITTLWLLIGNDQLLWSLLATHMVQPRNIMLAYGAYLMLGLISVFFGVGLVTCTRITLEERDSQFLDGFRHAARNSHWVILWTFISWTFGPILNLMDHFRYTTLLVRRMLHSSWSTVSYFVIPILIVDKVNIFSALRRSVDVMSKTWGKGAISRLGLYWFFLLLNLPTIAIIVIGIYPDGPWPASLTLVVLLYFYTTIVVYQTASSVLSVVLYKYASEGKVVPGFKEEHLKNSFVQPIIYVLATEAPGPNFRPLEEVKTEAASVAAPAVESNAIPETEADSAVADEPEALASEAPTALETTDNAPLTSEEIPEEPGDTDKS
jgi:hypothetical protein